MTLLRLPPLLGFPWERRPNEQGLGVLEPFVVSGAPLTKVQGQPVLVRWGVRNSGGSPAFFELYLTDRAGALRFVRTGPLQVNAGADTPVSLAWQTGLLAPGTYSITIAIDEVTSTGTFIRNLAAEDFSVTLTPTRLFAVGSRVRWVIGSQSFLGSVTQVGPWGDSGWQYVVVFDPGQAGNPASGWFWEFVLRPA